jgi:hypothetical protein
MRFDDGLPRAQAIRALGVSRTWALEYEKFLKGHPEEFDRLRGTPGSVTAAEGPKTRSEMSALAVACLDDFELFRVTVFGRRSPPWAVQAAHTVADLYATDDREFAVINMPPGLGKTTLFTTDIPAWLTCRRRNIRGALGAISESLSTKYVFRLRKEFERTNPTRATSEAVDKRGAVNATHTMSQLYGRFRPVVPDTWRREYFTVELEDGEVSGEKEMTWTQASMEADFIGDRLDFVSFDDAVTPLSVRTETRREGHAEQWDKVVEARLEPGGLLLLVGQRLHQLDLYRHCLDKVVELEGGEDRAPQYTHIVFPAHDQGRCTQDHGKDAAYWPKGCLADPKALPWKELRARQIVDSHNFELVYQQNDASHTRSLVQKLWVQGGRDEETGEIFPGCWDEGREPGDVPVLENRVLSYATVDPSAARYWVIQWWLMEPATQKRFLIDMRREVMSANRLLDLANGAYEGVMDDWQHRSETAGRRITHWIVEQNSQQKHLLQYAFVRDWTRAHRVQLIGHETQGKSKSDPKLGVEATLPAIFRHGLVRLPGTVDGRAKVRFLVDEATSWPYAATTDAVMACWFGEFNLPTLLRGTDEPPVYVMPRPSWMRPAGWAPETGARAALQRAFAGAR